jgi:hypothetical protein
MKKLVLIIAFILTGLTGTAQVTQEGYFSVKENFIIWTEIYDTVPEVETMFGNQFFTFYLLLVTSPHELLSPRH